jgi:tetratricopeptide (TPR) repeat protein
MSPASLKQLAGATLVVLAAFCAGTFAADGARREQAVTDLASPVAATREQACVVLGETGQGPDLPALMSALRDPAARVRQAAEDAIWKIWSRSGDAQVDHVFAAGVQQMQAGALREAAATFGKVIGMRPEFAEGWNKRATVYFLLGELDLSLKDCDEVVKRNPDHFGVLAGYGQIYLQKGDLGQSLDYFERALALNPNMDGVRASIEAIGRVLSRERRRYI